MGKTIRSMNMTKGLKKLTRCFVAFELLICISFSCCSVALAGEVTILTEKKPPSFLITRAREDAGDTGTIEASKIVRYGVGNKWLYLVPNIGTYNDVRGCFLNVYETNFVLNKIVPVAEVDDLEVCEGISSIFACNSRNKAESGVGVLYVKRIGAGKLWTEGTFFLAADSGDLQVDQKRSEHLTDIDSIRKAKKKLGCL